MPEMRTRHAVLKMPTTTKPGLLRAFLIWLAASAFAAVAAFEQVR